MPMSYKHTSTNNQDNMPLPETGKPIVLSPGKNNSAQNKNLNIAIINNKSSEGGYE